MREGGFVVFRNVPDDYGDRGATGQAGKEGFVTAADGKEADVRNVCQVTVLCENGGLGGGQDREEDAADAAGGERFAGAVPDHGGDVGGVAAFVVDFCGKAAAGERK